MVVLDALSVLPVVCGRGDTDDEQKGEGVDTTKPEFEAEVRMFWERYPATHGWLTSRRASDSHCFSASRPRLRGVYRNRAFDVDHVSHFDDVRATVVDHHDGPSGPAGASHR